MKQLIAILLAVTVGLAAWAQLPAFSQLNYDGWTYNRPNTELTTYNISIGAVMLYRSGGGTDYVLLSPVFNTLEGDSLVVDVVARTDNWLQSKYVVSKTALTTALLTVDGGVIDSLTLQPAAGVSRHELRYSIPLPEDRNFFMLRFACWKGDINSNAAISTVNVSLAYSKERLDINGDGDINVGDVNALLNAIFSGEWPENYDVNGDGEVNVGDVNMILNFILS